MSDQTATDLAQTANHISFAAAILAAGAFVAALLQVVLEYISSSEARFKCNSAAINSTSKQVRHRWSFLAWKMKLYYPELDFDYEEVINAAWKSEGRAVSMSLSLDVEKEEGYAWRPLHRSDVPRFAHVW
jgi:hypothetical protein